MRDLKIAPDKGWGKQQSPLSFDSAYRNIKSRPKRIKTPRTKKKFVRKLHDLGGGVSSSPSYFACIAPRRQNSVVHISPTDSIHEEGEDPISNDTFSNCVSLTDS